MKSHILIIEDNFHKFFTTKQVLEVQMKLQVNAIEVQDGSQLARETETCQADLVMYRPSGIIEIISKLKKRNSNCRNTEVTLIFAEDLDELSSKALNGYLNSLARSRIVNAA